MLRNTQHRNAQACAALLCWKIRITGLLGRMQLQKSVLQLDQLNKENMAVKLMMSYVQASLVSPKQSVLSILVWSVDVTCMHACMHARRLAIADSTHA